ncbi:phage portal protein [Xanthobacteraceae bacterium A53D]
MGLWQQWSGKVIRLTDGSFWKGFFGLGNAAGKTVTVDTALQLDAVWACVKLISETVGTLPCIVYDAAGAKVRRDHQLYELVHDAPSMDNTSVEFWEAVTLSLMLYGNAFAEKKMSGERLIALDILHPACVGVDRNARNERVYTVTEDGKQRKIGESRMFHVRGMSFGGDVGFSPIAFGRQTFGSAIAAEEMAGKMFANGMQVSGVLSSDQVLKADQRKQLGETLNQFAGSDRAGKVAVLEAGLKYQQLSINPQDAQMLETRRFSVEQICRWFGVPPVMIGHAAAGVTTWGSGVEQIILQFTKTGLRPILRRIEAAIRRDLMTAEDRKEIKVEFNMEGLLRGDSATRMAFITGMVDHGIYTPNEGRAYENKEPLEAGDDLIVNQAMLPLRLLSAKPANVNVTASPPTKAA